MINLIAPKNLAVTIRNIVLSQTSNSFKRISILEVKLCLTSLGLEISDNKLKYILDESFQSEGCGYYKVTQTIKATAQQIEESCKAYFDNFSSSQRRIDMTERFNENSIFARYTHKLTAKEQKDLFFGSTPFSKLCVYRYSNGISVQGKTSFGLDSHSVDYTWMRVADLVNFGTKATIW